MAGIIESRRPKRPISMKLARIRSEVFQAEADLAGSVGPGSWIP